MSYRDALLVGSIVLSAACGRTNLGVPTRDGGVRPLGGAVSAGATTPTGGAAGGAPKVTGGGTSAGGMPIMAGGQPAAGGTNSAGTHTTGGGQPAAGGTGAGGTQTIGGSQPAAGGTGAGGTQTMGGSQPAAGGTGAGGTLATGGGCGTKIDDMENGTGHICQGEGRTGGWYAFNSQSGTQWPAPTTPGIPIETSLIPGGRGASLRAMHTYSDVAFSYAGIGLDLSFDGTYLWPL